MEFPRLNEMPTTQDQTETFVGLDRNLRIAPGAMQDMENLTSDHYPMLAARGKRTILDVLEEPHGLLSKDKLVWVDGRKLYYGGENISDYLIAAGAELENSEKELVSMGAYIIILPDKVYINTADFSDCGKIEADWTNEYPLEIRMCMEDGVEYSCTAGNTPPQNPTAGQHWIDTSGDGDAMKIYGSDGEWTAVETVYCKISCIGIGRQFKDDDGVDISGCSNDSINGSHILYHVAPDAVVMIGMVRETVSQAAGSLRIRRKMPDMDFIIECQNRLWGCKYGTVDGKQINEIYCCSLGDFRNWSRYKGISTDSYTAAVGTDGPWTGAITFGGHPLFWKENHLHKVYVSASGAHEIVDTACRGVQAGCSKSLAIVDERLFFKSRDGVCYYDGSMPGTVGTQLGMELYWDAVGGSVNSKYYLSMRDDRRWYLFVFDVRRGIWMLEDKTKAYAMARLGDELYLLERETGQLMGLLGHAKGEKEWDVDWAATTGIIGYADARQKYVSRFVIRTKLEAGASAQFSIEYDSNGKWLPCGSIVGNGLRSAVLPVRPVRCDHFRIKMTGHGEMKIFSMARIYERGSDVCGY